jgi:small subunit ribosomal protein S6
MTNDIEVIVMAGNVYECMFLLDTTKVSGDVPAAAKQLQSILEKNNCEVLASRPWDERRLAYPIKNQKKGLYYLTYFRNDGKGLVNLDHDCKLSELIMRQLIIRVDPKMVDTMLTLARDEHALALQSMAEEPAEGGGGRPAEGGEQGDGRGARRGPRRPPEETAEKS